MCTRLLFDKIEPSYEQDNIAQSVINLATGAERMWRQGYLSASLHRCIATPFTKISTQVYTRLHASIFHSKWKGNTEQNFKSLAAQIKLEGYHDSFD